MEKKEYQKPAFAVVALHGLAALMQSSVQTDQALIDDKKKSLYGDEFN